MIRQCLYGELVVGFKFLCYKIEIDKYYWKIHWKIMMIASINFPFLCLYRVIEVWATKNFIEDKMTGSQYNMVPKKKLKLKSHDLKKHNFLNIFRIIYLKLCFPVHETSFLRVHRPLRSFFLLWIFVKLELHLDEVLKVLLVVRLKFSISTIGKFIEKIGWLINGWDI